MPRTLGRLLLTVALSVSALVPLTQVAASPEAVASPLVGTAIRSVYVRTPRAAAQLVGRAPLQVLLVLHGMGGNGEEFSRELIESADHYGWLIVAPTIDYGDWTNPTLVAREDPALIRALADYLDQLPGLTGIPMRRQVLVLGHSRGAQLAHRFAEFRPEKVLAVAALSAGTYTLPQSSGAQGSIFTFPFGVKDLAQYAGHSLDLAQFSGVRFFIGVGGQDNNPSDLPRQWDNIEGSTRVQRAQAFESAMLRLGAHSTLRVFGNAHHEVTSEMRQAACAFLGSAMLPSAAHLSPGSDDPLPF
jgi:pimeloyl-ACP methyl ester carboxylesterase